jgi:hypothetical protein
MNRETFEVKFRLNIEIVSGGSVFGVKNVQILTTGAAKLTPK